MRTHATSCPTRAAHLLVTHGGSEPGRHLDALASRRPRTLDAPPLVSNRRVGTPWRAVATRALACSNTPSITACTRTGSKRSTCPFTVPLPAARVRSLVPGPGAPGRSFRSSRARNRTACTGRGRPLECGGTPAHSGSPDTAAALSRAGLEGRLAARCLMPSTSASSPSAPRSGPLLPHHLRRGGGAAQPAPPSSGLDAHVHAERLHGARRGRPLEAAGRLLLQSARCWWAPVLRYLICPDNTRLHPGSGPRRAESPVHGSTSATRSRPVAAARRFTRLASWEPATDGGAGLPIRLARRHRLRDSQPPHGASASTRSSSASWCMAIRR